jgi:glyoxylase-like metal-dependent hydrolase (beta-lactamase superfamily II)
MSPWTLEGALALYDRLIPLVDEGLGNSAYLLDLGDGQALAVDPSLDLRAVSRTAENRGLRIRYAADTHLHADFLTGARQLAADHGALILAAAADGRGFPHTRLTDGDEIDLGGLTPGLAAGAYAGASVLPDPGGSTEVACSPAVH